jgi:hypothetical protein
MPNNDVSEILTPAARQLLEEAVKDYRAQVLSAAQSSAARLTGELREISVHDVLTGLAAAQPGLSRRRTSQVERVLYLYGVTGILMAVASVVYWLVRNASASSDLQAQLPLLLGASGLLMSVLSFLYLRIRTIRLGDTGSEGFSNRGDASAEFTFISQWRDLEIGLRRIAAAELGESGSAMPFSALVNAAMKSGTLSAEDANVLRRLIDLRNRILHKGDSISTAELRDAVNAADRLTAKLGIESARGAV